MKSFAKKNFSIALFLSFVSITHAKIITDSEIRDLQLLETYSGAQGLVPLINQSITGIGKDFFKNRTLNPTNDVSLLIQRQAAIQAIEDPETAATVATILKEYKKHESALYFTQLPQESVAQHIISGFYFKNRYLKKLNEYPAGLAFGQALHTISLCAPVLEHAIIHFLISDKLHEYLGMCCRHSHPDYGHKEHKHKDGHKAHKHSHQPPSAGAVFAYNAYNVAHTAIHVIGFKELVEHMYNQALTIKQMQSTLIEIRHCLDAVHAIVALSDVLATDAFEHYKALVDITLLNKQALSPELFDFLALLKSSTFAGSASLISRQGNVLRAYALAQHVLPELLQHLQGIGELDTLLTCAQLINNKNNDCSFNLTQYINDLHPSIIIQGFWNPISQHPNMIEDEILLGQGNPRIGIITGANKAGKSTATAAITLAIVTGQSLGISPAQKCIISPFGAIRTCFNANCKVTNGKSLFSASIDFADATLAESENQDLIFVATDELFNSTELSKGKQINAQMALTMASHSNCIALMATHFTQATALEAQAPDAIINLKAEKRQLNENHEYHLSPGIGDHENILELVKDSQLIKRCGLV